MLGRIGVVAVATGAGLGTWTIIDFGGCADECHSYAIPIVIAAVLVLAGSVALLMAATNWNLRRQLTTYDR
jgi:hypothetical protein